MWALDNRTPFAVERAFLRDKNGAEVWVIAVKGTFEIARDGRIELAKLQLPVTKAPEFMGEPGRSSLRYETDLVLGKPTTDIVLHGHAYAPRGRPATEVTASMAVGPVRKSLRVIGDRIWKKDLLDFGLSSPRAFVAMPITYERAYGGYDRRAADPAEHRWEPRNPVGRGFYTRRHHRIGEPAPNILSMAGDDVPAGFGPVAREWSPRVELAGTYDQDWQEKRLPLLPLDFDERFYQCAPPDQRAPKYLAGGESVVLLNLTPEGRLSFRLPTVRLSFFTDFGGDYATHRAVLHTVILEPDERRVQMVWHTHLHCHSLVYKLASTTVREDAGVGVEAGTASDRAGLAEDDGAMP